MKLIWIMIDESMTFLSTSNYNQISNNNFQKKVSLGPCGHSSTMHIHLTLSYVIHYSTWI